MHRLNQPYFAAGFNDRLDCSHLEANLTLARWPVQGQSGCRCCRLVDCSTHRAGSAKTVRGANTFKPCQLCRSDSFYVVGSVSRPRNKMLPDRVWRIMKMNGWSARKI